MGYYDPHPTLILDRPVALLGFMGAGQVATAMALGTMTGLNPVDLEARVSHVLGRDPRGGLPGGAQALRQVQLEVLEATLRDRPFGVVALPWDLPLDPRARLLLQQRARTCAIERDLLTLYGRVLDELDRAPGRYPALGGMRPTSAHDLMPHLAPLRPFLAGADLVLDAGRLHPTTVATELERHLRARALAPDQPPRTFSPR